MKFKFRFAGVALLAAASAPAWALQLGQIQVKSALNQPLVAAIPLHPKNLTELEGLTVGLAPAEDFSRAGLQLTPTDRTLQFRVITDDNGQKLILVTSSQPVTDPYLDFLLQVNTRQGKQVREFVVLLNPVIAAPAPGIQSAPVTSAPSANARAAQPVPKAPAQPAPQPAKSLPPSSAFPQPKVKPIPKPAAPTRPTAAPAPPPPTPPPPAPSPQSGTVHAGGTIPVAHGDTLYRIAQEQTQGTRISINQMMLALKTANPEAFFKNNINDLKAGAILRIPTRDEIDKTAIAEADAEVHRQYETWRTSRTHPATVVEGAAAEAAANAAPKPGNEAPASDHLALIPPSGKASGASNRPGVAGGTGSETVTDLKQQLQNDRGSLVSLDQSNADLEARVKNLKDISGKSDKLLSLKDATIAELQRKLAQVQSGKPGAAGTSVAGATASAASATPPAKVSAPARARAASKPAGAKPSASTTPWFMRPVAWGVAGLIVLALILFGLLRRRRGPTEVIETKGPLPDPADIAPPLAATRDEAALQARLVENPDDLATHLALCRLYYAQHDVERFVAAAQAMRAHVTDPTGAEWREVAVMGEELMPHDPLFAMRAEVRDDPYGVESLHQPLAADVDEVPPTPPAAEPASEDDAFADAPAALGRMEPDVETVMAAWRAEPPSAGFAVAKPADKQPEFADDPVDTKLDLARAYLDMGDPVGARAMLEEVLEEGSQTQKNEAKRLLAEVAG